MTKPLTIKEALAFKDGKFRPGVSLVPSEDLIFEQADWGADDWSKNTEFKTCPYWILTNEEEPYGIIDDQDFASFQDVTGED